MPRAYALRIGSLPSGVAAPTAAYTVGTQVGVPTGTSLTTTAGSSLPAHDATEVVTLTHPITGATADLTVRVWRRRRFTGAPSIQPGVGEHFMFDECAFEVSNSSWALDLNTGGAVANQMAPLYVLRRCTLNGNDTTERVLGGHFVWLQECHITGGSDAWQGGAWSVAERCNIIAGTDTRNPDPHSDGFQMTDTGGLTLHRCWISAGTTPGQNAALRLGTEFGAVDNFVDVFYCGLDRGGYVVQCDGADNPGGIGPVRFRGNRWTADAWFYGPTDFVDTTVTEWTNNFTTAGTPVAQP
ncbi:hypothetical protein Ait01nite_089460 [Actinoplanes italicus]|uniref:Pectinesterase n=1 Tax=Actinoplanes italicus TaxID=113567 RepID=A0A2T0JIU1_9ACTN|nr:hypothetical protein [Actinoplanes italicus]PRX07362.1 hypothetical protein CLV67_14237 [Actinoplanes italicus]GIE35901.1 hypothetical protein Ait01nite_089460 [Actinoplanes italicus]